MSATLPKSPQGRSRRAAWLRQLLRAIGSRDVVQIGGYTRRETAEGVFFDPSPNQGAASGWRFGSQIEVDTSKSCSSQIVINIQSTNALVTTGLVDRTTNTLKLAAAGMYVSRQKVSPVGADGKWNVPQNPMPVPGDYDDDSNFWIPIGGGGGTNCPEND